MKKKSHNLRSTDSLFPHHKEVEFLKNASDNSYIKYIAQSPIKAKEEKKINLTNKPVVTMFDSKTPEYPKYKVAQTSKTTLAALIPSKHKNNPRMRITISIKNKIVVSLKCNPVLKSGICQIMLSKKHPPRKIISITKYTKNYRNM